MAPGRFLAGPGDGSMTLDDGRVTLATDGIAPDDGRTEFGNKEAGTNAGWARTSMPPGIGPAV